MPVYEYRCNDCGAAFEETETLAQHETSTPKCPKCGSLNVRRDYSSVRVKTSRKS